MPWGGGAPRTLPPNCGLPGASSRAHISTLSLPNPPLGSVGHGVPLCGADGSSAAGQCPTCWVQLSQGGKCRSSGGLTLSHSVESGSSALHPSLPATTGNNAWWRLSLPLVVLILVASALGGSDSRNFRLTTCWNYDFFQKLVVFLSIFYIIFLKWAQSPAYEKEFPPC